MSRLIDAASISRFQKEKYLRSLTEDDFRDTVVRPLFFRLGFGDGRDTCGPTEQGRDALFTEKDNLGLTHLIAVQTKAGNVNLASKASQNLENAVAQLRTALNTTITLIASKSKCLPTKVYLCASGRINDAAKAHIVDQVRDPRIHFLDADEIIPRVDEHIPEIWFGIDADILPYFRAIKAYVEGQRNQGTSDRPDILIGAASDATFVSLNLYRATTRTKKVRGQTVVEPNFEEFPITGLINKKFRKTIILAEAGMGKSTAMLRIAYLVAEKGVTSDTKYLIPIIIRATEISGNPKVPLQQIADQAAKRFAGTEKSVFTAADLIEGRVLLLVDAADEVPSKEGRALVIEAINQFAHDFVKCRVIATARPYRDLRGLAGFETFSISPISWRQTEKIVKSMEKGHRLPAAQTKEVLRRLEQIHGIELNPLLVTVFAATSEYSRQDIPANITEVFKKFTELLLGRWDEQKGFSQQYQAPLKDFLLQRIAFQMHADKETSISYERFAELIAHELKIRGHSAKTDDITRELIERSGLFRVNDEQIEFGHHLLQEFFAGRGIASVDYIKQVVSDEWWKRPIVFYFGDNPGKVGRLSEVLSSIAKVSSERTYEAVTTLGLALQACYLSEVTEKIDIWKTLVSTLAVTNNGVLGAGNGQKYPITNFIGYYLYGRESVALANIADDIKALAAWAQTKRDALESKVEQESRLFWLTAALIELGKLDQASKLARDFVPTESMYLLALFLGARLADEVRSTTPQQRREAGRLAADLEERVGPLLGKLKKEYSSHLLEVREGEIEVVEPENGARE